MRRGALFIDADADRASVPFRDSRGYASRIDLAKPGENCAHVGQAVEKERIECARSCGWNGPGTCIRYGVGRVPTIRPSGEWGGRGPIHRMERVVPTCL
jgi:hypothetical protein